MSTTTGERRVHQPEMQFQDLATQKHAAQLGMWIFLAGEVLLFSAMFALYAALRVHWHEAFKEGAGETVLWMGTTGTVCLLVASFLVALSVHAIREDEGRARGGAPVGGGGPGRGVPHAQVLGVRQARIRGDRAGPLPEQDHRAPGRLRGLLDLYYIMTGAHAIHVIGGIVLLTWIGWRARRGDFDAVYHTPLELGGMYWHLVDVIWLFLWPFFYLMRS